MSGKYVSHQSGITTENRVPTTITDPQIIHSLIVLGFTVVGYLLIQKLRNGDMTNQWTNVESIRNLEIGVILSEAGWSTQSRIGEWSCMIPEIYL